MKNRPKKSLKTKPPKKPIRKKSIPQRRASPAVNTAHIAFPAVGHTPNSTLRPQDASLFRAFQANLLSLISHELRTPLTGILNSLTLLDEAGEQGDLPKEELISMARRNAQRLNDTLASLLDLASMESGTFHARLREVDFDRLARSILRTEGSTFAEKRIELKISSAESSELTPTPVLADPQKIKRALELVIHLLTQAVQPQSTVKITLASQSVSFEFEIEESWQDEWEASWAQASIGYQGGVASPSSAFGGVVQSEEQFLSRSHEGLGSEFLLIHEIMRIHQGQFTWTASSSGMRSQLTLELPLLSSADGLKAVLSSRIFESTGEPRTVALVLIKVPSKTLSESFTEILKKSLFRASDAVYSLPDQKWVALVMDDCKPEDVPILLKRIARSVKVPLDAGYVCLPTETVDAEHAIALATKRMKPLSL